MKKLNKLALGAALVLASTLASAQWYGGLSVGQGNTDFKSADFSSAGALADSHKSDAPAYKATVGYTLHKGLSLEGGYAVFGRSEYRQAATSGAEQKRIVENSAASLSLKYSYALNDKWGVSAKAGLSHNFSDMTTESNSAVPGGYAALDTKHTGGTSALYGVGVSYKLDPKTTLVAEYEDFGRFGESGVVGQTNTNLVSVGLVRSF